MFSGLSTTQWPPHLSVIDSTTCIDIANELVSSQDASSANLCLSSQVIVALATLQSSVQDLSRAYINHANTVLSGGNSGLLNIGLTSTLLDTGLVGQQIRAPTPPAQVEVVDGKKKRKRAPHDPNAPKRALTPYFLYMQSARAQIAEELGDNAKPKEVADEGTRRWGAMAEEDKSVCGTDPQAEFLLTIPGLESNLCQKPCNLPCEDEGIQGWCSSPLGR